MPDLLIRYHPEVARKGPALAGSAGRLTDIVDLDQDLTRSQQLPDAEPVPDDELFELPVA